MASTNDAANHGNMEQDEGLKIRTALELGSDDIDLPLCDPCEIEGSEIPAAGYCKTCGEYLCQQCYGYHCKPKPMRNHVLMDAQNMPKSKSDLHTELIEDCQEKCHKHENLPLKIYCRSHDEFGCVVCLSEYHKACDNVSFIQDCSKKISEGKEYQEFQKTLKTLETNFSTQREKAESEARTIDEMCSTMKTHDAIREITVLLEDVKSVEAKISETKTAAIQMLETVTKTCKDAESELQKLMSDQTSDTMKFVNMTRGQSIISKARGCLETMKTDIKFSLTSLEKLKTDIKRSFEALKTSDIQKNLTEIQTADACISTDAKETLEKAEDSTLPCASVEVIALHCNNVLDADEDMDMDCRITGSAMLSDGRVAFVDFCNQAVKIYSPRNNHLDAHLRFSSKPFDATEVHHGRIAVTAPAQKKIYLLAVNETELDWDTTINTKGSCYGICCDKNVLYVAFDNPPKVEVLNMTGAVLKSFVMDGKSAKLFSSPWYVAYNHVNSSLYITDREKDTVTCLTTQGKVVSVYKAGNLVRPYGVAIDSSGIVYVCARRTDSIYCLSPDFNLISVFQEGDFLHKPESVVCWDKRDRLYVGLYRDDEVTVLDIEKN